jgi:EAL domain-containing protein (putative c-di-GMP-specific phosphodiesterase class I)
VSRILRALEEDRFRLFGQLIAPLAPSGREPVRCEVLLRMVDADGSMVTPASFIPAAERYNLMGSIDRWVVRNVVAHVARTTSGGEDAPISFINLSGSSLSDPNLLDFIRQLLDTYDVSPRQLCFEVTETAAIANLAFAAHFIKELKKLGCWFALDDFGSGMSSFAYLQSLPVDYLKIAGTFSRRLDNDLIDYAMVEAINRVGHVMSLKTVAEEVESEEVLEKLREIGVDYAQGYLVAPPVPLEEFARRGEVVGGRGRGG